MDWTPLILTFQLALVSTLCLFLIAIPLAYYLNQSRSIFKAMIETLISMPLVLPPTVLGFYFLIAFSPNNAFGAWLDTTLGLRLVFSFEGLVLASIVYSLPFMIHPISAALTQLPQSIKDASYLMGYSKWATYRKIELPNIKKALLTGIILSFAHTVGEFGLVLMIGGSIPDKTRLASIAIYDEVEAMNYASANAYSLVLFGLSFLILGTVFLLNGNYIKAWRND